MSRIEPFKLKKLHNSSNEFKRILFFLVVSIEFEGKCGGKHFRRKLREMKIEVEFVIGCIMENREKSADFFSLVFLMEIRSDFEAEENIFCTFSIRIDKEASK